ncbi:hypothetical protein FJZ31_34265 [Candidatus Poribacteria bacterium]|nr:hypothetical protein [Candidatus Poribacteria bacterium]
MSTQNNISLSRDPYDALRLENDVLGMRLWGPPTQPTLLIGKADIWDRRWFSERQSLITMARIRELAMADRLVEIAQEPNRTAYNLYGQYDFPCPKPGAQVILGTPFATHTSIESDANRAIRLLIEGRDKRLSAIVWVALARPLIVLEFQAEGLERNDFWVRVYRHRDTILPGQPVDETLGGGPSPDDFEQLPAPRSCQMGDYWGITQEFFPELTFPAGFQCVVVAAAIGTEPASTRCDGERGLGTSYWAAQEGRLSHGLIKRYTPINESPGAAATATFRDLPEAFTILATVATTQDGLDPVLTAVETLDEARKLGLEGLRREQEAMLQGRQRKDLAYARVGENVEISASPVILPRLRREGGYYGDVPLCSVDSTKFCFQDAALWHADFHLNEIRAEPMLALGQFEELRPYCEMIYTLLAQAKENAHDVYNLPGAMYPLVHFPLRCRGIAHTNLTWEQDIGLNGLVSKPLWLYYRYTGDNDFLRDLAYPVLSECARFCFAYLTEGQDGRLHVIPTVSPEHWGLTARFERNRDCTSALTLIRYLLLASATAAQILGKDVSEATSWKAAAERLAPYPTYTRQEPRSPTTEAGPVWVDVAGAPPIEYNIPVPLTPIFWGDDVGLDSPPEILALAKRTLDQINVWVPHRGYLDSCVRPRLGIWYPDARVGPENLLLSYQSIHIFPAVPPEGEIIMENFAAEGGFRVSAVRTAEGEIHEVRIKSTLGEMCHVANPWPGRAVVVTGTDGDKVIRTNSAKSHLSFATNPGERYGLRALYGE